MEERAVACRHLNLSSEKGAKELYSELTRTLGSSVEYLNPKSMYNGLYGCYCGFRDII